MANKKNKSKQLKNRRYKDKIQKQELLLKSKEQSIVKKGRPSEYTPEEGDRLCEWITEGKSLRSYALTNKRSINSIYRWLRESGDFRTQYTHAYENRADTLADELLDITDSCDGSNIAEVQKARLRMDARKWIASKLKPSKYADHQQTQTAGNVTFNIDLNGTPEKVKPVTIDAQPL